jgi:hypothetical protein
MQKWHSPDFVLAWNAVDIQTRGELPGEALAARAVREELDIAMFRASTKAKNFCKELECVGLSLDPHSFPVEVAPGDPQLLASRPAEGLVQRIDSWRCIGASFPDSDYVGILRKK